MVSTACWPSAGLPRRAFFACRTTVGRSRTSPPAMAAPNVPTNTRNRAGSSRIAVGLLPSRTIETMTATKIPPMPAIVANSTSALPVGHRAQVGGAGPLGDRDRRHLEHLGAMGGDRLDDVHERLHHHVLRPAHQGDDRVGSGFDPLDEVGVE